MDKQFEVETYNDGKWSLHAVESTMAQAKRRVAELLRADVPESNICVRYVVREYVDLMLGSADNVISEYFNFCQRHSSCNMCKYHGEKNSVACLKRFISEWEGKEK